MEYFKMIKLLKKLFLESVFTRNVNINIDKPVFSFTFDDVPVSAAITGAKILEDYNVKGTYYVSGGIDKRDPDSIPIDDKYFIDRTEISDLHENGHDIACHTFSHLNLRKVGLKTAIKDCQKNINFLSRYTRKATINHFSYPFGKVSPFVKRALGKLYLTLRTTEEGINYGNTDFSYLKAYNIYSKNFDRSVILKIIQETIELNGWTIFYTHDVDYSPTEWGTTPDDFKWILSACIESNAEILSVNQAVNLILNKKSFGQL
jgi:peptidoglycan/xylan/chitin deacetylase (PgdA/CDA1 family)